MHVRENNHCLLCESYKIYWPKYFPWAKCYFCNHECILYNIVLVNAVIMSFKLICVVVILFGDLCRMTASRWTVRVRLCSETFCKWNVQTCVLMLRNSVDWWLSPCITTTNSSSNKERCLHPGPTTTATDTSSRTVTFRVSTDLTVVLTACRLPLYGSSP
jgi:hypothetical protein